MTSVTSVVGSQASTTQPTPLALAPPPRYPTGSIVTIRMRGHSRTDGQEYFAPSVVLAQHWPSGETIEVLVWDATAGTHYNAAYQVRELSTRGEGGERETYEVRSNVGQVLFDPDAFAASLGDIEDLRGRILMLGRDLKELRSGFETMKAMTVTTLPQSFVTVAAPIVTATAPPIGGKKA